MYSDELTTIINNNNAAKLDVKLIYNQAQNH